MPEEPQPPDRRMGCKAACSMQRCGGVWPPAWVLTGLLLLTAAVSVSGQDPQGQALVTFIGGTATPFTNWDGFSPPCIGGTPCKYDTASRQYGG